MGTRARENFSWAHFYSFLETKLKVKLGGGGSVQEIIFCMGILALKTLSPIPTPRAINANDTFDERTVALSQLERNQKRKGVSFYFFLLSAILHSAVASSKKSENAPPSLGWAFPNFSIGGCLFLLLSSFHFRFGSAQCMQEGRRRHHRDVNNWLPERDFLRKSECIISKRAFLNLSSPSTPLLCTSSSYSLARKDGGLLMGRRL